MRTWRTPSADQPEPERQEPSLYCIDYQASSLFTLAVSNRDYDCRSPSLPREHDPNNVPHPGSPSIR